MPRQRPTQQQQRNTGSANPQTPSQPLAPTNRANGQAQHTRDGATQSQRDSDKAKTTRERRAQNWLLVIFTGLVFIVTCVYAYFSYGQWVSMDKSITETQKNRELEYRAYVVVKGVQFIPSPQNPAFGSLSVVVVNTGRTPGLNGSVLTGGFEARDNPVPEDFAVNLPDKPPSKNVFGPQIDVSRTIGYMPTDVMDQMIAKQKQPQAKAGGQATPNTTPVPAPADNNFMVPPLPPESGKQTYAYGIILYDDIFGHPHRTKFCFRNVPGTPDWNICPTFNDAD